MFKNLDIDLLRTFVAIADLGGFAKAGRHLHKTQSAISLQMKRLEAQSGSKLFRKAGRRQLLTESGELLLNYARRILSLNDEAAAALKPIPLQGQIRFGVTQDFADRGLAAVLARFADSHPGVRLDVRVNPSCELKQEIAKGKLDLAVAFQERGDSGDSLGKLQPSWIVPEPFNEPNDQPLKLVLFEPPCVFRDRVINALEKASMSWRIVYTSPSLPGLLAAVEAGLGVTARLSNRNRNRNRNRNPVASLPELQPVELAVYRNPQATPAPLDALEKITRAHIQNNLEDLV
ncbi:MAG: LysR substrate-binding domain-containing protein [Candidatus Thiodiazotropha lotti]|nr:LysR substrate-binding domain-containing protein [Candidatus Thiodiazotropha lotti]MCG8006520.1 LysR substrate-binding domain-containing protein [Candidatus Thiodiazotropha lotti]MCW4194102.1 LysR substrate-binding domain-containing protein [Candidatus Thiodiazotropha lotti]MCW4199006.1 LysR substrate-binding domain-containing protein [Candidatus Thiodiazotropha lotti]